MAETIETVWELRTYDVVGNASDGYEVNDTSVIDRAWPITLTVEVNNPNTPQQFNSATPTDTDIIAAFSLDRRAQIETDGDDLTVYVNRARDNYPIGEMRCVSHASLSPIRAK